MLVDTTDLVDHRAVGVPQALEVRGIQFPCLAFVKHGRVDTDLRPSHAPLADG